MNDSLIFEKGTYVIVRTYSAGVFAGNLSQKKDQVVVLENARRLYEWYGAATISQLSMEGVKYPEKCKFTMAVEIIELPQSIEILKVTDRARKSIKEVEEWKI